MLKKKSGAILCENSTACFFMSGLLSRYPGISHGFLTRKKGFSRIPYKGFNTGISVGDDMNAVTLNRRNLAELAETENSVYLSQVHASDVLVIKRGDNLPVPDSVKADAVVTDVSDLMLVIQTADCQAVLLHDPEENVIAAVHSGWRGNLHDITGNTVEAMKRDFSCNPENIVASIGPSLGPCCAEFKNFRLELPESFWEYGNEKNLFDFWEISRHQLLNAGLKEESVECLCLCTMCNPELFFSYRRDKVTGRMANFIKICV